MWRGSSSPEEVAKHRRRLLALEPIDAADASTFEQARPEQVGLHFVPADHEDVGGRAIRPIGQPRQAEAPRKHRERPVLLRAYPPAYEAALSGAVT